jgi:hypothetical protein
MMYREHKKSSAQKDNSHNQ